MFPRESSPLGILVQVEGAAAEAYRRSRAARDSRPSRQVDSRVSPLSRLAALERAPRPARLARRLAVSWRRAPGPPRFAPEASPPVDCQPPTAADWTANTRRRGSPRASAQVV